ncbi:phosphate starvation-inducible protein PsiF [Pseudomonas putida]|uniref:Phosphate starvation-inducible protein PsiF n=10 Tax=Pseudomonas TaxID=286 RepID=A0A1L5PWV5_PSEPU|nr:phosphate starvation-inducible protein PsiF [Pseudomonas putida]
MHRARSQGDYSMKVLQIPLLVLAVLFSAQGFAANTAQQEKMKTCNADATAKALKGDERKAFMSTCLKKDVPQTQQEKMKTCNADATTKALKGDERKAFMSDCLKKK